MVGSFANPAIDGKLRWNRTERNPELIPDALADNFLLTSSHTLTELIVGFDTLLNPQCHIQVLTMSRHQAFRNVHNTLEEHYFDGGEESEEEELSAEDQALMQQGIADVKAALGIEVSKVSTEQIQEALWHYYYDVDKSVTYLLTKFIAPPPKAAKTTQKDKSSGEHALSYVRREALGTFKNSGADSGCNHDMCLGVWMPPWLVPQLQPKCSRFSRPAQSQRSSLTSSQGHEFLYPPTPRSPASLSDRTFISALFHGVQWGNIPEHRKAVFIEPKRPRGGLLGGSGAPPKLSKLQQLAAARKKKQEEKKSEEKTEKARQKLGELSVGDSTSKKENALSSGAFGKRQKLSEFSAAGRMPLAAFPSEDVGSTPNHQEALRDGDFSTNHQKGMEEEVEEAPEPAKPSAFAQTLLGPASDAARRGSMQLFPLPYTASSQSLADAFSEPSPDDVVLAAQAKGSALRKGKH